jgi:hypothetical protein
VKQLAQQKVVELMRQCEVLRDDLIRTPAGKPAERIKAHLRSRWQRVGGEITDPKPTTYAKQISTGGRVVMQVPELK